MLFGLGARLRVPALINFGAFYLVGIPLGAALTYRASMGVHGLWLGLDVAIGLVVVCQYVHLGRTVDWAEAARTARARALRKEEPHAAALTSRSRDAMSDGVGLAAADSAIKAEP